MARVSLRAACDQARQWLESNDLERAIGLCEHILQAFPANLEVYRILGEACLANRQLDRAQEAFERVLRSDPESIPAHVGLGITFERRGKLERAVQEFEQALEIKPDMPELRSQLLRLYSDGGIENAQLRLSRAGLARLYAKGQMLPQAIAEFRHVIGEQPNRYDAKVALAETLWRDEQEADAASLCRKLVAERAELLKAQLLLGYIDLSTGRPSGEQHWRAAAAIDPDLAVARALFDPLPPISIEPLMLDEWDMQAWQRQRDELEQIAATRPMQAIPAAVAEPEPQEFIPGASFFASRPTVPSFDPTGSDDFLAGLLDLDSKSTPAPTPVAAPVAASTPTSQSDVEDLDLGLDADMQPFSLSELGLSEDELAGLNPIVEPSPPVTPTPRVVPPAVAAEIPEPIFSPATPEPQPSPAQPEDDDLVAFSFDNLDSLDFEPDVPTAPAPADDDDLSDLGAFSLGLSDDEPVAPPVTPAKPATPTRSTPAPVEEDDLSDLGAFSLGLIDDEPAAPPVTPAKPAPVAPTRSAPAPESDDFDLGSMQPFSLADLGLSDEEIAGLESIDTNADTQRRGPAASQPAAADDDYSDLPVDLLPFSMDALDRGDSRNDLGGLPSALQPFSIDEPAGTQRPRVSGLTPDLGADAANEDDDEGARSQRGFSWQQPSTKPEANFASAIRPPEQPSERNLFSKLKQIRENAPIQPAEELPEVTLRADEHLGLFSLDDVPLHDQEPPAEPPMPQISGIARREGTSIYPEPVSPFTPAPPTPKPTAVTPPAKPSVPVVPPVVAPAIIPPSSPVDTSDDILGTIAAGDLQPFSLEELGLTEEEMAALGIGEAPAAPSEPVVETPVESVPITIEPSAPAAPEHIEINTDLDLQSALATGEVQPFSFADLGLSDEEIAALGLGEASAPSEPVVEPPAEPAPTIIEPAAPAAPEHIEINTDLDLQSALATGEVQPFSFADLGLSDEEIAALGLGEAPAESTPAEPALEAFSLDLDTPGEAFSLDQLDTPSGLPEPQPFSLDLDLDLESPVPPPSPVRKPEAEMPSLDDDLRPFSLGEFGFADDEPGLLELDLPDALSNEDPNLSLTAEELAGLDVGGDLNLKEGGVIRPAESDSNAVNTGDRAADRLITLGRRQGYVDISDIIAAVENPEEEADRIEAIGQLLHQQAIEIRDGDEIIDMDAEYAEDDAYTSELEDTLPELSAGETGSFKAFDIPPAPDASEPEMTPFSLTELGLSDDEIAMLGLGEVQPEPTPSPAAQPEEPDLVSFSLSELGLDDEPAAPPAPVSQPAPVVPPTPVAPAPQPAVAAAASTGSEMLDQYLQRVDSDPENHPLRLSVARASARIEQNDLAIRQYKQLIRRNALLDDVVDDLSDLIAEIDDQNLLRQLHRTLGDAYSKQGFIDRAMEIYAWTPGMPKAVRP